MLDCTRIACERLEILRDLVKEKRYPGPVVVRKSFITRVSSQLFSIATHFIKSPLSITTAFIYLFRINRIDTSPLTVDDVSFLIISPILVVYRLSTGWPRGRRWSPPPFAEEKHRQSFRIRWCMSLWVTWRYPI